MEGNPYLAMTSLPRRRSALTSKEEALEEEQTLETAPRDNADDERRRGDGGKGSSMKDSGGAKPSWAALKETSLRMPGTAVAETPALTGKGTASGGGCRKREGCPKFTRFHFKSVRNYRDGNKRTKIMMTERERDRQTETDRDREKGLIHQL